jgi:hypothetical protein
LHGKLIYEYLSQNHSVFLEKLKKLGLRYIRIVGAEDNPDSPIGRGWKNIFKVENKVQAEQKMK